MMVFPFIGLASAPNTQTPTESKLAVYFPPEAGGTGSFFAANLDLQGEPSLLDAARDPALQSYRINWMSEAEGRSLFVRVSLTQNGKGEITVIENPMSPKITRTTRRTASSPDVAKFLEMIHAADFWAMPSQQPAGPGITQPIRHGYRYVAFRGSSWGSLPLCLSERTNNESLHRYGAFSSEKLGRSR
jgi:hypothetical protein